MNLLGEVSTKDLVDDKLPPTLQLYYADTYGYLDSYIRDVEDWARKNNIQEEQKTKIVNNAKEALKRTPASISIELYDSLHKVESDAELADYDEFCLNMRLRQAGTDIYREPFTESLSLKNLVERIKSNPNDKKYLKLKKRLLEQWKPSYNVLLSRRRRNHFIIMLNTAIRTPDGAERFGDILKSYGAYNKVKGVGESIGKSCCSIDAVDSLSKDTITDIMQYFNNYDVCYQTDIEALE